MNYAKPLFMVASLTLAACSSAPGEVEEPVELAQQASLTNNSLTNNSLTNNSLTNNSLTNNSLTNNSLTNNSLTNNSLTNNSLTNNALQDPDSREVLKYIVSCALPPGDQVEFTVDGTSYTYDGQLGLAPQWGLVGGSCDVSCQRWVSACLLARVDYTGTKREISIRGSNPSLSTSPSEQARYSVDEATYFGNLFVKHPRRFACLAPGQSEILRVCGPTLDGCLVDVNPDVSCADVCDAPQSDGAFPNCRADDGDRDDRPYAESITVFLKRGEV